MSVRRVAVVGGGPGGLYAARLIKLADPSRQIDVYEQGEPDTTFGFGVGLAAGTQRNLADADPDTLADIVAASRPHGAEMRVGDANAAINFANLLAIARTELLALLQRRAEAAGVRLHFGARVAADDLDADLVVAADGVSSASRESASEQFGATVETGAGLYLWCGADFALPTALFAPATAESGIFVTHAYPYAPDRSTFLVETDEKTWRSAGFDLSTERTPANESDEFAIDYLSDVFAAYLGGRRLIGNRTRWLRFRTVRCSSWRSGRIVLLGDAAHTAHYSIGSGTKLAMEDAIALATALGPDCDLDRALDEYERVRRASVEQFQSVARRSQLWWESFPTRTHLPIEQLTLSYMTRAGRVPVKKFCQTNPDVARSGLGTFGGVDPSDVPADDIDNWVLARPLAHGTIHFPSRVIHPDDGVRDALVEIEYRHDDPWGAEADALVQRAVSDPGALGFWITGANDRESLLDRFDIAERLRFTTGALVVVEGPHELGVDLSAGLASGRADLVAVRATEIP